MSVIIKIRGNDRGASRFIHSHASRHNTSYKVTFNGLLDYFHFDNVEVGKAIERLLDRYMKERRTNL